MANSWMTSLSCVWRWQNVTPPRWFGGRTKLGAGQRNVKFSVSRSCRCVAQIFNPLASPGIVADRVDFPDHEVFLISPRRRIGGRHEAGISDLCPRGTGPQGQIEATPTELWPARVYERKGGP